MSEHTRRISASSNWRDSEDGAKDECNRILDSRSDDAIQQEEHDGSYLVGSSYTSYSIETRDNKTLFRCTRSRDLRFREYETDDNNERVPVPTITLEQLKETGFPIHELQSQGRLAPGAKLRLLEQVAETQEEYFAGVESKVRARLPQTADYFLHLAGSPASVLYRLPLADVSISDVKITKSHLRLAGKEETVGVPFAESIWKIPAENCGKKISLEINRSVEYQYTSGFRITTERSISDKYEITGKINFDAGELGGTVSREVSFRESKEYTDSHSERRTQDVRVMIPAESNSLISIIFQSFEVRRAFEGPATLDSAVVAHYREGDFHMELAYALSQLLPDEGDRSFIMKGHYGTLDTLFMPIKVDDLGCPASP